MSSKPKTIRLAALAAAAVGAAWVLSPATAEARNIVLTNDDGLSSNIKALYEALKAQGHDVIVSVPCANQSGMGTAVYFMKPLGPLKSDCRNLAGRKGDPGAGPMTRPGFEKDYFYVDGTPVMAMFYGIDVAAVARWGKAPDLVLSGPNEGQNVGRAAISSGTVSNAQHAASRGIPAVALSAGLDTEDNVRLANPVSKDIARLSADLVRALERQAGGGRLLPENLALNVNFPDKPVNPEWKLTRMGTYSNFEIRFADDLSKSPFARMLGKIPAGTPGISIGVNPQPPAADQADNEAAVYQKAVAVTVMQVGYDYSSSSFGWIADVLRNVGN